MKDTKRRAVQSTHKSEPIDSTENLEDAQPHALNLTVNLIAGSTGWWERTGANSCKKCTLARFTRGSFTLIIGPPTCHRANPRCSYTLETLAIGSCFLCFAQSRCSGH